MNSEHVSIERTVNFLVDGSPLENWEHEHLLRCTECTHAMVQAALQELQKRKDASKAV
jgi:hypothetical protein